MSMITFDPSTDRQERRQYLKEQIARTTVALARADELQNVIHELHADNDRAADAHQAACEPLQAELAKLDARQVKDIAAGKPIDQSISTRRRELLRQITTENQTLEQTVNANQDLIKKTEKEIGQIRRDNAHHQVLLDKLASPGIADPELVRKQWVISHRSKWANARLADANAKVANFTDFAAQSERRKEPEAAANYRARLPKWQAIASDAAAEVAQLRRESEDIRRQMIAE